MTSLVDFSKPEEGMAYTADVRSNFEIIFNEIGALQDSLALIEPPGEQIEYLPLTGGTLSEALTIASDTDPTLYITSLSPTVWPGVIIDGPAAYIQGMVNGVPRWEIDLGDGSPETGGNTGSNFGIYRYNDTGGSIDPNYVFLISRETGMVSLTGNLEIKADVAGYLGLYSTNTSAADGAIAELGATNDVPHYASYGITGSGYVGYVDTAYLETNAAGGLQLITDAAVPISFWIGGIQIAEVNAAGITTQTPPITTGVWNGYQVGLNMLGSSAEYGSAMVFGGPAAEPYAFALLRFADALYISTMPALDDTSGTYGESDLVAFTRTKVQFITDIAVNGAAILSSDVTVGRGLTVIGPITTAADPAITGVSMDIIATGDVNTGWAYLYTANQTGTADAGEAGIGTGSTDAGNGGTLYVYTGNSTTGSTGNVFIYTGGTDGAASKVGDVKIWTGSATNGAAQGNLLLPGLPTADPHRADAVWADATAGFVLKVSQG
jgi:hypothetical protein